MVIILYSFADLARVDVATTTLVVARRAREVFCINKGQAALED